MEYELAPSPLHTSMPHIHPSTPSPSLHEMKGSRCTSNSQSSEWPGQALLSASPSAAHTSLVSACRPTCSVFASTAATSIQWPRFATRLLTRPRCATRLTPIWRWCNQLPLALLMCEMRQRPNMIFFLPWRALCHRQSRGHQTPSLLPIFRILIL
jgi:hypothetical protein